MRGIKIPLQDFALKMQGGLMHEGGGGVFVGHYGIFNVSYPFFYFTFMCI